MGECKSRITLVDLIGEHASTVLSVPDPVQRVTLITGEKVWLATGYAEVRTILSDPRFSAGGGPLHRTSWSHLDRKIGRLLHSDAPEHGRYRGLVNRAFAARRINAREPRIREVTRTQLDVLAAQRQPADLIEHFALPVPEQVIHEILGTPESVRPDFRALVETLLRRGLAPDEGRAVTDDTLDLMCQVIAAKRARPADDLLSEMAIKTDLTDIEQADLAITLLMGGFLTITGMIAETVLALNQQPGFQSRLLAKGELGATAVEELLRYITIIQYGIDRVARCDLELGKRHVRAGDRVVAFLPAANEDASLCPVPHILDIDRPRVRHASFGFGPHQCVGQQLARVELRVMITELLRRFPGIQVAQPHESLRRRTQTVIGGFDRLPVNW
ncbi:cytochrome P450 [Amycolatopsis japonica]